MAITILGMVILGLTPFGHPGTLLLITGTMVTYLIMVITLCIITQIYLIVSFYRSLFTHQGYLTFTLLTYLSILLLFASSVGFSDFGTAVRSLFTDSLTNTSVTVNGVTSQVSLSLLDLLGLSPFSALFFLAALTLVGCFYSIATGYASAAIGQLFAKHKVAATVITYLIIYFVMQFFYGIVSVLTAIRPLIAIANAAPETLNSLEFTINTMSRVYHPLFLVLLISQLVVGVILYLVSGFIMNKKINLD